MTRYAITAVMPALNEERNLASAVANVMESFEKLGISGQIIIVNDGSNDQTGTIAESFKAGSSAIDVIHHPSPQGIGASFWDGVQSAKGDVVTMIPGDGENDATEILRYLPLLEQVDIVVPFVFNREVRSFRRRLLSIIYREIIKASFGLSLNYMNGTVMYRRSILEGIELKCSGFFYQTELLIKTIKRGYLYAEVPYALNMRGGGESKATTLSSLRKVALAYLTTFAEINFGATLGGKVVDRSVTFRRTHGNRENSDSWKN
jgi:glycosyltransferase involved in cell wall biosynthesis